MSEPLIDGLFKFSNTMKSAAPDHSLSNQAEPSFHLVEPGTAGWGEEEMEAAALLRLQPALHLSAFMGAVIVHDQMNLQVRRHGLLQLVQKLDELARAMSGLTTTDDFAGRNIKSGKQGGRAVALVNHAFGAPQTRSQGQDRGRAIERLNLAFFVHRQ